MLTKRFTLTPEGELVKTSAAQMVNGLADTITLPTLSAFAEFLNSLEPCHALSYGVAPGHPHARVVSQKHRRDGDGTITRARTFFQFIPANGIMMLDHDPNPEMDVSRFTPATFIEKLIGDLSICCPALFIAPAFQRPSVSNGIRLAQTRSKVTGNLPPLPPLSPSGGQRIYVAVADARLIPEAGKALVELLWAAGHGYVMVGKAGQILYRTLVDATVWQPERLDFAGPPVLGEGLVRDPPEIFFCGDRNAPPLDLRRVIELADGAVKALAQKARVVARNAAQPQAQIVLTAWAEQEAIQLAERGDMSVDNARDILVKAAEKRILTGGFLLTAADGKQVTVGELLDHPAQWHGKRFSDPLEPDYGHDARIAWANLRSGGKPYIYSHAHGGRRFYLERPSEQIQLAIGQRARVVDSVLDLLQSRGGLFDMGDGAALARATDDARAIPVTQDWLLDYFGRVVSFYKLMAKQKEGVQFFEEVPSDAPLWAAKAVLAKDGERELPRVDAVVTAPTLRTDGSIIDEVGFDHVGRLLYLSDIADSVHIPIKPTITEATKALTTLWEPFHLFPLVDEVDRGVTLAAILSALIRASLPTCPGFGFDAPLAGSGKTLMAQAVGALTLGFNPAALPPASGQDEEVRKRLFSALRNGYHVILLDNVREPLGTGAMDAFLTAPTFADRILGKSEMATLPNRALFLVTGNNLRLVGDTCRRILIARMDPAMEKPYTRSLIFVHYNR